LQYSNSWEYQSCENCFWSNTLMWTILPLGAWLLNRRSAGCKCWRTFSNYHHTDRLGMRILSSSRYVLLIDSKFSVRSFQEAVEWTLRGEWGLMSLWGGFAKVLKLFGRIWISSQQESLEPLLNCQQVYLKLFIVPLLIVL